jgi:hypothetical protein
LSLFVLVACQPADPDALLHAGRLEEAAAAATPPVDVSSRAAQVLGMRARQDRSVTIAVLREAVAAVRLLDESPATRTQKLDVPLDRAADLGAVADALGVGATIMAVGRSETPADPDPWTKAGDLPWARGRVFGYAEHDLAALGARLDANPPVKLVTVGIADQTGAVWFTMQREGDAWETVSASDAEAAARLLLAAGSLRDYGAAGLRERVGEGIRHR